MIKIHHIHSQAAMLAFKCQSNVLMIRRDDGGREGMDTCWVIKIDEDIS